MKEQSMGQIVREIRVEQGMTQEVLADGICTTSYLSRVEHGSQIPSREIYQSLMERLGESGYSYAFWKNQQKREQKCRDLLWTLQTWESEKADEKLLELREMKKSRDEQERQFYEMAKTIWLYMSGAIPREEYLQCCLAVWECAVHANQKVGIHSEGLMLHEMTEIQLWVLNNVAIGYMWKGELHESASLLFRLYRYVQKVEKGYAVTRHMKAVLGHNLSVCMLEMEKPEEALYFSEQTMHMLRTAGGIQHILLALRVQMEAYQMLESKEDCQATKILLHRIHEQLLKERGNWEQIEKRLWDRRTLFVIF